MSDLQKRIESAINGVSAENGSNTPDFILAEFLVGCLAAWNAGVTARERWYGRPAPKMQTPDDVTGAPSAQLTGEMG